MSAPVYASVSTSTNTNLFFVGISLHLPMVAVSNQCEYFSHAASTGLDCEVNLQMKPQSTKGCELHAQKCRFLVSLATASLDVVWSQQLLTYELRMLGPKPKYDTALKGRISSGGINNTEILFKPSNNGDLSQTIAAATVDVEVCSFSFLRKSA